MIYAGRRLNWSCFDGAILMASYQYYRRLTCQTIRFDLGWPWYYFVKSDLYDSGFEGFDLPLRDPVHLLSSDCTSDSENGTYSAASETRQINWIYPTKRLLKGSVQYHVFYLGGTQEKDFHANYATELLSSYWGWWWWKILDHFQFLSRFITPPISQYNRPNICSKPFEHLKVWKCLKTTLSAGVG